MSLTVSKRIEGVLLIREWERDDDEAGQCTFWCPGCEQGHTIAFGGAETWTWDGNAEAPTFDPSVLAFPHEKLNEAGRQLVDAGRGSELTDEHRTMTPRCHSFVRAGMIEYLADSTHALAGQTVRMVPLPAKYSEFVD